MAATGVNITALAWETLDTESPTRAEYQANWNAVDTHNHDGNGHGLPVRSATSTAPSAAQHVCVTGDLFEWWGATSAAVKTAVDTNSSQTLTNKTLGSGTSVDASLLGGTLGYGHGGTGATALTQHGAVVAGASALSTVAPGASGNLLTSNGTDWTSATPASTTLAGDVTGAPGSNTIANSAVTTAKIAANAVHSFVSQSSTLQYSTVSTAWTDMDATNLSGSITTSGGDVLALLKAPNCYDNTGGDFVWLGLALDGTDQTDCQDYLENAIGSATLGTLVVIKRFTGLSAATHTIRPRIKVSGGGTGYYGYGAAAATRLELIEIKK